MHCTNVLTPCEEVCSTSFQHRGEALRELTRILSDGGSILLGARLPGRRVIFAAQFKAAEFGLGHRQSEEHTRKLTWEQLYARNLMVQLRKTLPERMEHISFFQHWLWDKLWHNGVLENRCSEL